MRFALRCIAASFQVNYCAARITMDSLSLENVVTTEEYQDLLLRFCEQERFDYGQFMQEGILTLDGRGVALHFAPEISAFHILVRADLGTLSKSIEMGCFRSMLKANYQWGFDGAVFSINPASDAPVLTARIAVDSSTSALELRKALNFLAGILRHWSTVLEGLEHHVSIS